MRISLNDAVKRAEAKEHGKTNFTEGFKNIANFYLKDGEKAVIQLLVNDASEIPVIRTHTVQLFSKTGNKYFAEISCKADEGHCPLCEAKKAAGQDGLKNVSFAHDKLIIPIAILERGGVKETSYALFTRSINFYTNSLNAYSVRFGLTDPIEISRSGSGTSTTYTLFPTVNPEEYKTGKTVEEIKRDLDVADDDVVGRVDSVVKTWNPEQMNFYLETSQLPSKANMSSGSDTASAPANTQEAPVVNRRVSNHGF